MNTIFSFNRFSNYMIKSIILSKSKYLYLLATIISSYFLVMLLLSWIVPSQHKHGNGWPAIIVCSFLFIPAIISPCLVESPVTKHNGTQDFTTPISLGERFLKFWLQHIILLPVFTFGIYYLLSVIINALPFTSLHVLSSHYTEDFVKFLPSFWLILLGIQSVYIVGRLYFEKYAFLKTTTISIIIFILLTMLAYLIVKIGYHPSRAFDAPTAGRMQSIIMGLDHAKVSLNSYLLKFIFPFGMWIVAFLKIREKEI